MKIDAFFTGIKNANKAESELRKAGFKNIKVDINDHYISNMHHSARLPGTETCPNLSTLVLEEGEFKFEEDSSAIKAASPMVSGMGNFEEIADINYKISVETKDSDSNLAKDIIKDLGGEFKDPNLNIPNRIKV